MGAQTLHVFSGTLGSRERARLYSEPQWERPAPDDTWSEAAYSAWEARNPSWALRRELTVSSLDSDFIETIFGPEKISYLQTQLAHDTDFRMLRAAIPESADTLVLIMSTALGGFPASLAATPVLQYHGEYPWRSGT